MKVVFVGTVVPQDVFCRISKVSPSTNNVQLNYIKYFYEEYKNNFYVFSSHFGLSKISPDGKIVHTSQFVTEDGININCVGFINRRPVLNISTIVLTYLELRKIKKQFPNEKIIYIVNNHFYAQSLPAFLIKRKKDYLITILNEAFDVRYLPAHDKDRLKDYIANAINLYILKKNNGLITFSKQTVQRYAKGIPYIELIHACDSNERTVSKMKSKKFRVLYAGLINDCYGLRESIDAMKMLPGNYEFLICGGGDKTLIEYITKEASEDKRIKYLGLLNRNEVLSLEKEVDLLLLIRVALTEKDKYLAKYSQPSKVAEYMLSGTPILATDIDSIPKCLKEHMILVEASSEEIARSILTISNNRERTEVMSKEAFLYAQKYCSTICQKKKMIDFIEGIVSDRKE